MVTVGYNKNTMWQSMFKSHPYRLYSLIIILLLAVGTTIILLLINQLPGKKISPTADLEKRLTTIPEINAEPVAVMSYSGQIKQINQAKGNLILVTINGEKTVTFNAATVISRAKEPTDNLNPPALYNPDQAVNNTKTAEKLTAQDLLAGMVVKATSLTNISGSTTFKANSIVIIKANL